MQNIRNRVFVLESDDFLLKVLLQLFESCGFVSRGSQILHENGICDIDFFTTVYFLDLSAMGEESLLFIKNIQRKSPGSVCIVTYVANGPELLDLASLQNFVAHQQNCVLVEKPFDFAELKSIIQGVLI
jgi:CheY-like chemotaxis protein